MSDDIKEKLEGDRMDEGLISKISAGDEPVAGSIPVPSVEKKQTRVRGIQRFKLDFRRPDGQVRYDIPTEIARRAALEYGDLLKSIPHYKWVTMEEIVDRTWSNERKSPKRIWERSRRGIEDGVKELINMGIVLSKVDT